MKTFLLAALAAMMLSGCELLMLACDDDFTCDRDFSETAKPAPAHQDLAQ